MSGENEAVAPVPATETPSPADTQTAPEGEGQQSDPAPEKETEEAQAHKRQQAVERRINRLARERSEARAEADFYRNQATRTQPQQNNTDDERPLTRAEIAEEFQRFKAAEEQADRARRVQGKVEKARAADPEFSDALDSSDVEFRPDQLQVFAEAIEESNHGVALLAYITKTPGEADRLAELSPLALSRELGRLETKVAALAKPQKSNAPTPLDSVRPSASAGEPDVGKNPDAWVKWRNEQVLKQKAAR